MSGALSEVGYPPDETRGAGASFLELARRTGLSTAELARAAQTGSLAALITGSGGGQHRDAVEDDVDEQIYQRARRLEQTYQCMPEADRRRADIEVRKRRVLRAAGRGESW